MIDIVMMIMRKMMIMMIKMMMMKQTINLMIAATVKWFLIQLEVLRAAQNVPTPDDFARPKRVNS